MKRKSFLPLFGLLVFLTAWAGAEVAGETPEFNRLVLKIAREYPTDGTHDYWWPRSGESDYDGCTQDLYLQGQRVMKGEPQKRTFCCGLTLEVFLRAYETWLKEHPKAPGDLLTPQSWPHFQKLWFVLDKNGPGPSAALEAYKLGRTIPAEVARPGDFVQIWRTPKPDGRVSGHSVIFLDWVRDDTGNITGMRYWSTQPGTRGIRETVEYYGPDGGIAEEYTYFARVEIPQGEPSVPALPATTQQ